MAEVGNESVWGVFMSTGRMILAIVGSGLSLSVCAAYLAEKLQYLKPVIMAIQLPLPDCESDVSFAFPPFAEPLAPVLRRLLAETSLDELGLFSGMSPDGFAFNFAPYGIVSGAITFPHAYEICRQHSAGLPSYDSFLGVQPSRSPGILYTRAPLAADFQHIAVQKGVIFVPSRNIKANLSNDGKTILSVETCSGQVLKADYFIDCSTDKAVMQHLQEIKPVPERIIPSWSITRRTDIDARDKSSVAIKFDRSQANCAASLNGHRYEKIYNFEGCDENCGYVEQPWLNNCVALGKGFICMPELLIDTDRILERQLATLSWLLGVSSDSTYASRYFNGLSTQYVQESIDATNLLLQPVLAHQLELTANNRRRVALFLSSASAVKEDNLLISENAWVGLLHFAGHIPKNTNAVSVATDAQRIIGRTKSLLSK